MTSTATVTKAPKKAFHFLLLRREHWTREAELCFSVVHFAGELYIAKLRG